MTENPTCTRCQQPFTYERKFRPRIYCDTCRPIVYKEHATSPYDPAYAKWYRENVRKPRMALTVSLPASNSEAK